MLGGFGWGVLKFVRASVDTASYFQHLSFPMFLLAGFGLYWIQLMILAVILLFSSAVRGSFPVLLLTLCFYFICFGLPVVREAIKQKIERGENSRSVDILLQGLTVLFPDFSWLDFKTLVASNEPSPETLQILNPFLLSFLYIAIVLWLACSIYKRRDLQWSGYVHYCYAEQSCFIAGFLPCRNNGLNARMIPSIWPCLQVFIKSLLVI